MSKEVNRYKVFQTTRVRTALKNDGCWITKSKQEDEEQDRASADHVGESKPSPVRQKSYVLSTAKKFESIESPPSSPYQKPQFCPSEGDSANQANCESIPPQPEGSTVEPTADAKPPAPTEEPIQNGEAQPETSVAGTTAENNEAHVNVEDPVAETSAAAVTEETKDAAEVPAVEVKPQEEQSAETEPANVTLLEDAAAAAATQAEGEAVEEVIEAVAEVVAKSSSDTSDVVNATPGEEAALQNNAEPAAEIAVEPTPETPAATTVQHVEVEAAEAVEPAAEIAVEPTPEIPAATTVQHAEVEAAEAVEPAAEVAVEPTPETPAATTVQHVEVEAAEAAEPAAEAVLQDIVEADAAPVTPVVTDADTELPTQPAAEAAPEESSAEEAAGETVESVAEAAVESSPETPAVTAAAGEEAALQDTVEAVADIATSKESSAEDAAGETVEAVVADVAPAPEAPAVTSAAAEEAALQASVEPVPDLLAESVSELPATEPAAEESSAEQPAGETAEAEAAVESAPETPAAEEEAAPQDSVEPVPDVVADTVSESPTAEAVECRVESAEPVLNSSVESEVQPAVELNIEDALEPVAASDAEDTSSDRLIKLTDALDVEPPAAETAPEPPKDPEHSTTEEAEPSQDANTFEKPVEKPLTQIVIRNTNICSFCDSRIEGNVKIHLSEPPVTCHPDCLKCGVCATFLGDLLTPMFLHVQVIQCGGCFAKVLAP